MRVSKLIIGLSVVLIVLAITRFIYYKEISERMDATFFVMIAAAFLLPLLPLERLKSLKAGGIELSMELPQVEGAIGGLGLSRIDDKKLRERLAAMKSELEAVVRSRVLWIDDNPHKILGERRLLRALGIEVITAVSSEAAEQILKIDNDFDLLISDIQRTGESYTLNQGIDIHEGVNFIVKLRNDGSDPVIGSLPVVFYAAYDWKRLLKFTQPAREFPLETEISRSASDFIPKVVKQLALVRSSPIVCEQEKTPTPVGENYG